VTGWFQSLADTIRGIPDMLPDWITGRSPPPIAFALWDTADALDTLLPKLSAFNAQAALIPLGGIQMGMLATGVPPIRMDASADGAAGASTIHNYYLTAQYENQARDSLTRDVELLRVLTDTT
jgi:hypothetical protein